jgi:hypothetical protein
VGSRRSRNGDLETGVTPSGVPVCGSAATARMSLAAAMSMWKIFLNAAALPALPSRSMTRNSWSLTARISLTPLLLLSSW